MKIAIVLVFALFCTYFNLEARRLWVLFDSTNSLMEVNSVNKVLVDKNDNVWFATAGYGINNKYKVNFNKYKNGQFTVYNPYNSLKGYVNNIHDIMIDMYGNPWIASQTISIAKFQNNIWQQFKFDTINEYSHNDFDFVNCIIPDENGKIWIGSMNGLYKIDLNMNLISPIYKYPLKRNWAMSVFSLIKDKNNDIWFFAIDEALFRSSDSIYQRFDYDSIAFLKGRSLKGLVLDSLYNIWFCAVDYLSEPVFGYFNGIDFKLIDSTAIGFKNNYLFPLGTDRYNNVWLVNLVINPQTMENDLAGLVKYDGKTWQLFDTTNTDLPTNTFYSISFDSFNNMWLGTDKGLLVINFGEDGVILDVAEQNTKNSISISPNPATDYIKLSESSVILSKAKNPDIYIFDLLGIEQSTPNLTPTLSEGEGAVRLDVSSLSPGVYFVRVGDVVRKFVKM